MVIRIIRDRWGLHSTERNEYWTKLRNGMLPQIEACSLIAVATLHEVIDSTIGTFSRYNQTINTINYHTE